MSQTRRIDGLVLRIKDTPKNNPDRDRAFAQLLDIARSPNRRDKLDGTARLPSIFADLIPEQQEEVIDLVYDLCEDGHEEVRIKGYRTIADLSREAPNWTRRNTDVLVQLLQSDSNEELRVIRNALVDHIQIAPTSAFTVMTEHCLRSGQAEAEGLPGGGIIKGLVLEFLLKDAREARKRMLIRGGQAESTFCEGMVEAMTRASHREVEDIISLLADLPSFSPSSSPPNYFRSPTIRTLLHLAAGASPTPSPHSPYMPSQNTFFYFDRARELAARQQGDARLFLQFFCDLPWGKMDHVMTERYPFSRSDVIDVLLRDSFSLWDRGGNDGGLELSESQLGSRLLTVYVDLFQSALDASTKAAPTYRDAPWSELDHVLSVFARFTARRTALASGMRHKLVSDQYNQLLQFTRVTKDSRGSGMSPEINTKMRSICFTADRLAEMLKIGERAVSKALAAPPVTTEANRKRRSDGVPANPLRPMLPSSTSAPALSPAPSNPRPIRDLPKQQRSPVPAPNTPMRPLINRMAGVHLEKPNAKVENKDVDMADPGAEEDGDGPRKRPRQLLRDARSPNAKPRQDQPATLLERINSSGAVHNAAPASVAIPPKRTGPPPPISLAERLGVAAPFAASAPAIPNGKPGMTIRTANPVPNSAGGRSGSDGQISIKGAAQKRGTTLLSRLDTAPSARDSEDVLFNSNGQGRGGKRYRKNRS